MKGKWVAVMAVCCLLCGCSVNSQEETETEQETAMEVKKPAVNIGYKKSRSPVEITELEDVVYSPGETALLTVDGETYGSVSINGVYKLDIGDWYNAKAVNLGLDYSYSVNCNIDATQFLDSHKIAVIDPDISIVSAGGEALTEKCCVGWSGFMDFAELYVETPSGNIEVGMQPVSPSIGSDAKLRLKLSERDSGIAFDPIYFSIDVVNHAVQGQKLHVIDDPVEVLSINGASYSLAFNRAELNERTRSNRSSAMVYDLVYTLGYHKEPESDRVVSIFDSFDSNKISPNVPFYVEGDNDACRLYDTVDDALEYTDKGKSFLYVSKKRAFLCGDEYRYKTNRRIESNVLPADNYVRCIVEFPEERAARTDEEMLDFNARYLVYQIQLSEHVVPRDEDVFGE